MIKEAFILQPLFSLLLIAQFLIESTYLFYKFTNFEKMVADKNLTVAIFENSGKIHTKLFKDKNFSKITNPKYFSHTFNSLSSKLAKKPAEISAKNNNLFKTLSQINNKINTFTK